MDNRGILSSFDFSNVENPFKELVKNATHLTHKNEPVLTKSMEPGAVTLNIAACISYRKDNCEKDFINGNQHSLPTIKPSDEGLIQCSISASGGSDWEKQILKYCVSLNLDDKCKMETVNDVFEMPIDFIMDKCLLI